MNNTEAEIAVLSTRIAHLESEIERLRSEIIAVLDASSRVAWNAANSLLPRSGKPNSEGDQ